MKSYENEIDGQKEFYQRIGIDPDLSHNTDGVYKGNLYENKLLISNINKVLFQAIKYASRIRIRGEKLPANLVLNDLNREIAYIFKSKDFIEDIEKVYFGGASKNNEEYTTNVIPIKINYSNSTGLYELLSIINKEEYVKYTVDKNNILGLAQQYYKVNQSKDDFLKGRSAEIRVPKVLDDRIIPYNKGDNLEFEDIMDCLNPDRLQREQGAFYTPRAYVKKMQEMLLKVIDELPINEDGKKDYLIIDRCAGTGNLEEGLSDEVLGHCVLSTIEFNEYVILNYKFGDKCLVVIPNTDALKYDIIPAEHNEQGVENDFIREKINDRNCHIILVENPPYSEVAAGSLQNAGIKQNTWKESFVMREMEKERRGAILNELGNLFIWSGFKYYLRSEDDYYIIYSPTKYWRCQNLVNKKFVDGFICNRKHFHATPSSIGCICWKNEEDTNTESLTLPCYDIEDDEVKEVEECKTLTIKKAHRLLSENYDLRKFEDDKKDGILFELNGSEFKDNGRQKYSIPLYNKNIVAYMNTAGFGVDAKNYTLTRGGTYKGHGFYVREDNFLEKIPMFIAAVFPYDKWYKTDVYSKCFDGNGSYVKDKNFLKMCLIYTCLTYKNKCRSLIGSDKRFYRNELCFEKKDTLASRALEELIKEYPLTGEEKELLKQFDNIMLEVQETEEYKRTRNGEYVFSYGIWQIQEEINIKIPTEAKNRKGEVVYALKYPSLNTKLITLKQRLADYYEKRILPFLFTYELIK